MVDLFTPKCFNNKAVDFEKKYKKLDKAMISKVIERKNKDNKIIQLLISNNPLNI